MISNTKINVFIENEYEDFKENIDIAKLSQDCEKMLRYFLQQEKLVEESCLADYKDSCELLYFDTVLFDDDRIHEVNLEYRQKDAPTDVITFAIFADSPTEERFVFDNEINLGEILVSLDRTKAQALDNSHHQHSFEAELYFLLAHGILHLLGYDHQDENSLQRMWDIQQEIIKGAGINV